MRSPAAGGLGGGSEIPLFYPLPRLLNLLPSRPPGWLGSGRRRRGAGRGCGLSRAGPLGGGPRCRPRPDLAHLGWSPGPPGGAAARPSGPGEGEGKGEGSGRCRAESGAGAGRTSRAVAAAAGHGHPTGCGPSFQASGQRASCREGRGEFWAGRCWALREKGAKICGFIAGWRLRPPPQTS